MVWISFSAFETRYADAVLMADSSLPDRVPWEAEDYAGRQISHLRRKDVKHFWTIKSIGRHGIKFNAFDTFLTFDEIAEKFTTPLKLATGEYMDLYKYL